MKDWKWVKGYEGLYKVTRDGRVFSEERLDRFNRKHGGEIKPNVCGQYKYNFVILCKDGIRKQCYVHRLVAEAFIPNPKHKPCVDHIDNDKYNNKVENLRWVTYKENMNNPITLKRMREESQKYVSQAGADNPFSRRVAMYSLQGELIEEFDSAGQITKKYGFCSSLISSVCNGKRKQTHGYIFRFIGEAHREIVHKKVPSKNRKPVLQLSLDGNVVAEYNSVYEATQKTGFLPENIGRAARGLSKSYKGYKWRYK